VAQAEHVVIPASPGPIVCSDADVCSRIKDLKKEHDRQRRTRRVRPRVLANNG
jgi:hypothetical protein